MKAHESISAALRAANDAGHPALVPFLTAGYPKPDEFADVMAAVSEVGDLVEVGVPFSDPMADGMTIQRSSYEAIRNGVSLRWILDQLTANRRRIKAPVVLMSYLNPLLAYGYDALARRSLDAGVCGFIVPDLPYEESEELRAVLDTHGIGLVQLVTPATPADRLRRLADASRGFLYAVTITGITGSDGGLPANLATYLDRVSSISPLPVCAGFGIRAASDVESVGRHAAGAIVGSALVEVLERGEDPAAFLRSLRP
ncbi:MAG: tryptophan synthase subunit alpha [Halioglobus sp.]|nr:tryptophan synthase subunit alpha [Halioglobus sp.]